MSCSCYRGGSAQFCECNLTDAPAPPPASFVEVAPMESEPLPTEPDASPLALDLVILANARRALGDAERLTAAGMHASALAEARDALYKLTLALSIHDRRALLEALVNDDEPLLSGERDVRPEAEAAVSP